MGVELSILFEPEPERPEERPRGGTRWVTDHLGSLDELARAQGLIPLGSAVWEYDPEWDESDEEPEDYRPPSPQDAAEGLRTVSRLLELLRADPEPWRALVRAGKSLALSADEDDLRELLSELAEFERCLGLGAKRGARFYLQQV